MSGSLGGSKSGSDARNVFDQQVWGQQGDALADLYSQAGQLFAGGKGGMQPQAQAGQQFGTQAMGSMMQPWEQQMAGGAYADMDLTGAMERSLADMQAGGATNVQDINAMIMGGAGNTYADAMKQQYMQDASRAQEQMLGNLDARAAAAGMSGGSRHGTATAQGMEDINRNLQRNLATTGFETFDKDLERKLDIARQADVNQFQRAQQNQQTIANMMGGQQAAMGGGMQFSPQMMDIGMQQQMMPWQQAGAYSNILGAPTVLGSGSGTQSGSSKGKSGSGGSK